MLLPINQNMNAARLQGLVPYWLKYMDIRIQAREISSDTRYGYKWAVNKFLAWLGEQQTTPDVLIAWKADLLNHGYRITTVTSWVCAVRSFFTVLASAGQIPFNPAEALKLPRRYGRWQRHTRQPLTDNEVRRLLAQPDRDTIWGKRDYAMLNLMLYTAARNIELYRADLADLETQRGKLVLMVQGKGRIEKDAVLVLLGAAETAMADWLAVRGNQPGPLFISLANHNRNGRLARVSIRRRLKSYFARAGVNDKNKTVHSLRHTAITNAIIRGAPAEKLRAMTRHSTLEGLMVYYHETDRLDDPAERYIDYGE